MEHPRELEYALGVLIAGGCVDVVGRPASGRSRFLRELADLSRENGMTPLLLHGVASLRGIPLAALAMAGVGAGARQGAAALAAALDELAAKAAATRLVVLVDDAEEVDAPSWGVVAALARTHGVPVVTVRDPVRPGDAGALADPVLASAMTVELGPLSLESTGRVIAARLDGPVAEETAALVFAESGGLVGLALAIVDAARRDGRIVADADGVWTADGGLWDRHLVATARSLLARVEDRDRDALAKIALTGFIGSDHAAHLVGPDTLERLESLRLITSSPAAGGLTVGVSPPLLAQYLVDPAGGDAVRAARLRHEAESVVGAIAPAGQGESPASPHAPDFVFVRMVRERQESDRASSRAEWDRLRTPEAAAQHLQTLVDTEADDASIEAMLAVCERLEDVPAAVRARIVEVRAQWLTHRLGDADAALRLIEEQRGALGEHARVLDPVRLQASLATGTVPADAETWLEFDDSLPVALRGRLLDARAYLHLIRGRFDRALADWSAAHALDGYAVGCKEDVVGPIALLGAGRSQEAVDLANAMYADARLRLDVNAFRCSAYALSLVLIALGRFQLLDPILDLNDALGRPQPRLEAEYEALRELSETRPRGTRTRLVRARATKARPELLLPAGGLWPRRRALTRPAAVVQTANGLWASAEDAWARGATLAGAIAALTSLEMTQDAGRLAATRRRVRDIEPGYVTVLFDYVEALTAGDPVALRRIGARLARQHLVGHAYVAFVRAEELLRAAGDGDAADDAAADRRALMGLPEFADVDSSRFLRVTVRLTDREIEIARRAAGGASNQAIADGLGVGVRTVESHLHRAMRKLGAPSRADLGVPLRDYLALRRR